MTFTLSIPQGSPAQQISAVILPASVFIPGPETGTLCANSADDDGDGVVNDGCRGVPRQLERGADCDNSLDDDADGYPNDGCPVAGVPPAGAVVGRAYLSYNLGLIGGPCDTTVAQGGYLLNASVDNSPGNEYGSLKPWSSSEGPLERFRDDGRNGNWVPNHADRYPLFVNALFDPDRVGDTNGDWDEQDTVNGVEENPGAFEREPWGTVDPVRPLARYSMSWISLGQAQLLQLVVFAPGALSAFQPPHPFADLSQAPGYVMLAVIGNPTNLSPAANSITDVCSPVEVRITLWGKTRDNPCTGAFPPCYNDDTPCNLSCGSNHCINSFSGTGCLAVNESDTTGCSGYDEAGCVRYANPATAGTHLFYVYQQSLRDADNDGKENTLDTCPLTYDTLDPRTGAGPDSDSDLIADACDSWQGGGDDQDGDGFKNTQDNCPQANNPDQKESETVTPHAVAARRGGSRADGMGDVCDPNPMRADGHFHTTLAVIAKCIGGTDADGDGWCASGGPGAPNDPNDSNAARTPEDYDLVLPLAVAHSGSGASPPEREPKQVCNDGIDNDGDTLVDNLDSGAGASTCRPKNLVVHPGYPACPASGCYPSDTDGDGYTDGAERHIGTDALGRCGVGAVPSPSTAWPSDFVSGGIPASTDKITITDLTSFLAPTRRLDTSPGNPNFNVRWDLVPGPGLFANWIVINDLTALLAGPSASPPMFSGAKALNGPACTNGPMDY